MKALASVRAGLLVLIILLAGLSSAFLFWDRADRATPATTDLYALPTTPAAHVELYGPTVTLLNPRTVQCQFKYRFVGGTPAAADWYCCLVEFEGSPGSHRWVIENTDLQAEGILQQEIPLIRPGAKSFQIYLADAVERHGPYRRVSNLLTGPVLGQAASRSPAQVTDFCLKDSKGQQHTLTDWKDQQAIVLLFIGTECPVSNGYAPEYARLAKTFTDKGVRFYGVHPDPDVTAETAAKHATEYHLDFTILLDPTQAVAKQTGVKVVPEAVVLSPRGQVLYRGRIDDRYLLDGKRKDEARVRDLEDALKAVVAGKNPPVAETKAYGCPLPLPAR